MNLGRRAVVWGGCFARELTTSGVFSVLSAQQRTSGPGEARGGESSSRRFCMEAGRGACL